MLKSKKALYVLLPLTILIWGLVSYKVYIGLKGEEEVMAENVSALPLVLADKGIDTFSIFNNYRDPFLSTMKRDPGSKNYTGGSTKSIAPLNNNGPKPPLPPVNNDWPAIQYSGILKNQTNSTSLILLSMNGKMYTLKQGDVAEGMKVVSFSNEEVTLQRGKDKRRFPK